jgi:hypothetical protein
LAVDPQPPVIDVPQSSGSAVTAPPERADEILLEGPRSRIDEFVTLLRDFLRGFRVLHFVGHASPSLDRRA